MRHQLSFCVLLTITLTTVTGCGQSASKSEVAQADQDLMSDLLGDIDLTEGRSQEVPATTPSALVTDTAAAPDQTPSDPFATLPSQNAAEQFVMATASDDPTVSTVSSSAPATDVDLSLRLNFGDRFSLVKTVQQTLTQKSAAWPTVASNKLELHMNLEVQQVRSDASLLRVTYTRIRYQHDINGQQQAFDSATTPPANTPAELAVYAGMVNNGFSFWLGADNTIRELVGYNAFLQRCVASLPVEQQAAILAGVSDRFGTQGVAGFVDDSIGILPYRNGTSSVAVGDIWTRDRTVSMPVPVQIRSTCQLVASTASTATIQVTETLTPAGPAADATVAVSSGRSMATCQVDRASGMPVDVNRTTFVQLQVITATGESVPQEKQITTRVQSTTPAARSVAAQPAMNGYPVQQASGDGTMQQVTPIPTTVAPTTIAPAVPAEFQGAPLSSTATAVY